MAEILLTSDVARQLRCSTSTIHKLERDGKLPVLAKTKGGVRLFDASDVRKLADQRKRESKKN